MSLSRADRRRIEARVAEIASHAREAERPRLSASYTASPATPHALPQFLRLAKLQLHAQLQDGRFRGAGQDIECDLRGLTVFLEAAEEMAVELCAAAPDGVR